MPKMKNLLQSKDVAGYKSLRWRLRRSPKKPLGNRKVFHNISIKLIDGKLKKVIIDYGTKNL